MSVIITKTNNISSGEGDAPSLEQTINVTAPVVDVVAPSKPDANDVASIAILGATCAVIAYGCTQVIKSFCQDLFKVRKMEKPWWYLSLIRLLCIVFGGVAGFYLRDSFGPAETHFAIATGCGAGVLSTSIVAGVKKKIKAAAPAE